MGTARFEHLTDQQLRDRRAELIAARRRPLSQTEHDRVIQELDAVWGELRWRRAEIDPSWG